MIRLILFIILLFPSTAFGGAALMGEAAGGAAASETCNAELSAISGTSGSHVSYNGSGIAFAISTESTDEICEIEIGIHEVLGTSGKLIVRVAPTFDFTSNYTEYEVNLSQTSTPYLETITVSPEKTGQTTWWIGARSNETAYANRLFFSNYGSLGVGTDIAITYAADDGAFGWDWTTHSDTSHSILTHTVNGR